MMKLPILVQLPNIYTPPVYKPCGKRNQKKRYVSGYNVESESIAMEVKGWHSKDVSAETPNGCS
jgi:hypothetical protein